MESKIAKNRRQKKVSRWLVAEAEIIAKKGNDFFTLDFQDQNLTDSELVVIDGHTSIPEIDKSKDRGFSSPVDDLRKFFTIKNRHDLDSAGVFMYEVNCPFIMRWNKTQLLSGVPNVFLDPTAPSNEHRGKNHDWAHYFTGDYTMYYRVTITATKDGVPQVYTLDSQLQVEDYLQGDEWDNENTKAFGASMRLPVILISAFSPTLLDIIASEPVDRQVFASIFKMHSALNKLMRGPPSVSNRLQPVMVISPKARIRSVPDEVKLVPIISGQSMFKIEVELSSINILS